MLDLSLPHSSLAIDMLTNLLSSGNEIALALCFFFISSLFLLYFLFITSLFLLYSFFISSLFLLSISSLFFLYFFFISSLNFFFIPTLFLWSLSDGACVDTPWEVWRTLLPICQYYLILLMLILILILKEGLVDPVSIYLKYD